MTRLHNYLCEIRRQLVINGGVGELARPAFHLIFGRDPTPREWFAAGLRAELAKDFDGWHIWRLSVADRRP